MLLWTDPFLSTCAAWYVDGQGAPLNPTAENMAQWLVTVLGT